MHCFVKSAMSYSRTENILSHQLSIPKTRLRHLSWPVFVAVFRCIERKRDRFTLNVRAPGVPPPPLPGDKSFPFNGLRVMVVCKNVITKGLRLNLGK